MAEFLPIYRAQELFLQDVNTVQAGYWDAVAGEPPPDSMMDRGYHHGHFVGQVASGKVPPPPWFESLQEETEEWGQAAARSPH